MSKNKNKSFEESLRRLKEISDLLESEEIELEESIKLYEEGIKLSKDCFQFLNSAELKVTKLKDQLESGLEKLEDSND
jgi:exodeoxyribonuclease VII small subunit